MRRQPPCTCPCCGYRTVLDSYDICEVCDWVYLENWYLGINSPYNPNLITIREAQQNFAQTGMSNGRPRNSSLKRRMRNYDRDPNWRPLPAAGAVPDWTVRKDFDCCVEFDQIANICACLGLPIASADAFKGFMEFAAYAGESRQLPDGFSILWSPGEGIEAWVNASLKHRLSGCNSHYAGSGRARVRIDRVDYKRYSSFEASASGWLLEDESSADICPISVGLPAAAIDLANVSLPVAVDLQVAAFARQLQWFSTFQQMQASNGPFADLAAPAVVSAPPLPTNGAQPVGRSEAALVGTVRASEQKTNPLTNEPFHVVSVASLGGTFDVVAAQETLSEPPAVGGILAGRCYLCARIVPPAS